MDMSLKESVLSHQLRGIMFHADACTIYKLVEMKQECKRHYAQYIAEMTNYIMTRMHFVEEDGEYVQAEPVERVELPIVDTKPDSESEIEELHHEIMTEWKSWEEETLPFYEQLMTEEPDCKLWKRLAMCVQKELKKIDSLSA